MTRRLALLLALAGCRAPVEVSGAPDLGAPALCDPQPGGAAIDRVWRPPKGEHLGQCTSGELDSFLAALPGGESAARAWGIDHTACFACLWSDWSDVALGPIVNDSDVGLSGNSLIDGNLGGCVALVEGSVSIDSCGVAVQSARECAVDACGRCPLHVAADRVAFDQCLAQAGTTLCHVQQAAAGCVASVPGAAECRPDAWPTAADWLRYLGELFCGGGSDGGVN